MCDQNNYVDARTMKWHQCGCDSLLELSPKTFVEFPIIHGGRDDRIRYAEERYICVSKSIESTVNLVQKEALNFSKKSTKVLGVECRVRESDGSIETRLSCDFCIHLKRQSPTFVLHQCMGRSPNSTPEKSSLEMRSKSRGKRAENSPNYCFKARNRGVYLRKITTRYDRWITVCLCAFASILVLCSLQHTTAVPIPQQQAHHNENHQRHLNNGEDQGDGGKHNRNAFDGSGPPQLMPLNSEGSDPGYPTVSLLSGSTLFNETSWSPLPTPEPSNSSSLSNSTTTNAPTLEPSSRPTQAPVAASSTSAPTALVTGDPTVAPVGVTLTDDPTSTPTGSPTVFPVTVALTNAPTDSPTGSPTGSPTRSPTIAPTQVTESPMLLFRQNIGFTLETSPPTPKPDAPKTDPPVKDPTSAPVIASTPSPTRAPEKTPTSAPIPSPTEAPQNPPLVAPIPSPTAAPQKSPTAAPLPSPTGTPQKAPTPAPLPSPTGAPQKAPTGAPQKAPTGAPQKAPTRAPTSLPTEAPQRAPTAVPTPSPTSAPQKAPTTGPTPSPTRDPTKQPTATPTKNPTHAPTRQPTVNPTTKPSPSPSESPSATPTKSPTRSPSKAPTKSPSKSPTRSPTGSPSISPSGAPSVSARPTTSPSEKPSRSNNPTPQPTPQPTAQPTASPSEAPTRIPSAAPTLSMRPTNVPSTTPSSKPSDRPSNMPSNIPSSIPSSKPSSMPSSSPTRTLQRGTVFNVILHLDDQEPLNKQSAIETFEQVTANFIWTRINETLASERDLYDIAVEVYFVKQTIPSPIVTSSSNNSTNSTATTSSLVTTPGQVRGTADALIIWFDVEMSFRSSIYEHDWEEILVSTLNNKSEQERLIIALQDSNDSSFNAINQIRIEVGGENIFEADPIERQGDELNQASGGVRLAVIVAPVLGAVCAIIFVAGILVLIKKRNQLLRETEEEGYGDDLGETGEEEEDVGYIEVKNDVGHDDVSTIGDPLGAWGAASVATGHFDDPTVGESTIKMDYEYRKHITGAGAQGPLSNAGGEDVDDSVFSPRGSERLSAQGGDDPTLSEPTSMLPPNPSLSYDQQQNRENDEDVANDVMFSDEATFDQQFNAPENRIEVHAPPGKLGVVIDTSNSLETMGLPMVSAVKDTSCLADKVMVGDILTSIDGFNVSGMSASQVSKIISSKASNPTRILVFTRGENDQD